MHPQQSVKPEIQCPKVPRIVVERLSLLRPIQPRY